MARFCNSNQKRGFTLVELIVVLVILAVLAALLIPSLTGYINKAVEKRIMLQARSLMTAAQATIDEAYAKGELPIDDNGRFKPLHEDTAHKLAKQIIELSELEGEQYTWKFQLVDPSNTEFPTAKIAILEFTNGKHRIMYRIRTKSRKISPGWGNVKKFADKSDWSKKDDPAFLSSTDYKPDTYHPQSGKA